MASHGPGSSGNTVLIMSSCVGDTTSLAESGDLEKCPGVQSCRELEIGEPEARVEGTVASHFLPKIELDSSTVTRSRGLRLSMKVSLTCLNAVSL